MLSSFSNYSLRNEINNLRRELNRLYVELGSGRVFDRAIMETNEMYQWKQTLFYWKKIRLEALEAFANAQFVISKMEWSAHYAFNSQRVFNKPRPRRKNKKRQPTNTTTVSVTNNTNLIAITNNAERDSNKENQSPPDKEKTSHSEAPKTIKTEKEIEKESEKNMAVTIANTLKNLKVEKDIKPEPDDFDLLNSNIDSNSILQSVTETANNIKVEIDIDINSNQIVSNDRKRKQSNGETKLAKKGRTQ